MARTSIRRLVAIGAAVAVLAAACGGGSADSGDKVKIAFVAGQIGIQFYTGVECGAKAAAKEFNVDLNWTGSHNWDINETRPLIDAAKATSPQGWVISPTDPDALVADIKGFMDAKQWVVTIDAPMSEPVELQNLQSNHYQGGEIAAKAMLALTGGTGKYLVLHMQPGLPDIGGRADGFRDARRQRIEYARRRPALRFGHQCAQFIALCGVIHEFSNIDPRHFSASRGW